MDLLLTPTSAGEAESETSWVRFQDDLLFLRPLRPDDMQALQKFFYSHDPETVRLRYGYQRDTMTSDAAAKLVSVDQSKDHALGIFTDSHGHPELRAIGRYYLDAESKSAEVAFVVHEENRHAGIAGFLLGELATVAQRRGIQEFWASVMPDNRAMAGLFLATGGIESTSDMTEEREFRIPIDSILMSREKFLKRKGIFRNER
jgi:RimJ/RimL family protein N-acetyltransferase